MVAKTNISKLDAYNRLAAKCALGEQCSSDTFNKCLKWGLTDKEAAEIVEKLVKESFINDSRFAGAFTRDKIRYQGWGKIKVAYQLRLKGLESNEIKEAADSVSDDDYFDILKRVLNQKLKFISSDKNKYEIRATLARHAAARGFESPLIFKAIDEILSAENDNP